MAHFEAHRHLLQLFHSVVYGIGVYAQQKHGAPAVNGIFYRGVVGKRNGNTAFIACVNTSYSCFSISCCGICYTQGGILLARPGKKLLFAIIGGTMHLVHVLTDALVKLVVIQAVYQLFYAAKEE